MRGGEGLRGGGGGEERRAIESRQLQYTRKLTHYASLPTHLGNFLQWYLEYPLGVDHEGEEGPSYLGLPPVPPLYAQVHLLQILSERRLEEIP